MLGPSPPDTGIHHQTHTEQHQEIINSNLGKTGGLPLSENMPEGEPESGESNDKDTALSYLSDARDLAAQEGVWRASNIIAIIAAIQTFIGAAGLIALWYTLKATRATLEEAKSTTLQARLATKAANDTADIARTASILELKPYLGIQFHKIMYCNCSHPCSSELARESQLDSNQWIVSTIGHCLQVA